MPYSSAYLDCWTTADEINFINQNLIPICLELGNTKFLQRYFECALVRSWDESVNAGHVFMAAQDAIRLVERRIAQNIAQSMHIDVGAKNILFRVEALTREQRRRQVNGAR